ncbi:MAG: homoserine dehydrogenase, partial [Alphaproteobacteria bacterium]
MSAALKIAVAGLGTVGAGVLRILQQNGAIIEQRSGRAVEVSAVSARDRNMDRGVTLGDAVWYDDAVA